MDVQSMPETSSSFSETCILNLSEESFNFNFEDQNENLEKRLGSLKGIMEDLRAELTKERELWKKEVEEAGKLTTYQTPSEEQICTCCCEEENYNAQVSNSEPTLSDMSVLDYEQKLSVYQQALSKAHAEKRMHLRRHLAANAYKRRLLELENMCNLELLKVRQNVQNLQPLQAMVSEWNFDEQENPINLDDELIGRQSLPKKEYNVKNESITALENFGNKMNSEIKELAARISPAHSSLGGTGTGTTSSLIPEEDEDALMMRRLQSVGWYWYNDKNNYPFNPLM